MSKAPKMLSQKEVEWNLRNWEKNISREEMKICQENVDRLNKLFHQDPNLVRSCWVKQDKPFAIACIKESADNSGRTFTATDIYNGEVEIKTWMKKDNS